MSTAELTPLVSSLPGKTVRTGADTESPMSRDDTGDDNVVERWRALIDHKLIEWGSNPSLLEDEGIDLPSGEIIQLAIRLAEGLRNQGLPVPDSVVPDPNGGIVFERRENGDSEAWHVWDDGAIEYQCFQGSRLVERRIL